ncbi:hypothetical protein SODG_001249 [Sodalis praecaptivus]
MGRPLDALYRQLRRQNKKLVLRDYTDDDWPRRQLQSTVARMPADVRASLKATAVDYRPGFANNPAIGAMGARKIWIDIDLWGIDYGWTLLPCLLIDELQGRLSWAQSVAGDRLETITARLDWEWIHNSPLQGSINEGNLYGLARIAGGETSVSAAQLLDEWLDSQGLRPGYTVQRQTVRQLFISSYDWMCRTPYLLGRVMHQHSQLPADIDTALRLLHSDARSANWRQSFQALFPRDDEQAGRAQRELLQLEQQQNAFWPNVCTPRRKPCAATLNCPRRSPTCLRRLGLGRPLYAPVWPCPSGNQFAVVYQPVWRQPFASGDSAHRHRCGAAICRANLPLAGRKRN